MKVNDEREALRFLMARKKYLKNKELFPWPVATFPKIEALCKKYKVRTVDFDGFYKNIPMEAVDELELFSKAYHTVEKEYKPMLKLVIDDGGKEDKKDPILLASSPFGRWYYMLGAWDKEVQIVDDLIYKGK